MNTEPTIDRREIKAKWGLNKVSDVTNARKALGHSDWQNSLLGPDDTAEIDLYFELVLNRRCTIVVCYRESLSRNKNILARNKHGFMLQVIND